MHYLHTVIFLLQRWAVFWQSQLAQPSRDRLMLHGDTHAPSQAGKETHTQSSTRTTCRCNLEHRDGREELFNLDGRQTQAGKHNKKWMPMRQILKRFVQLLHVILLEKWEPDKIELLIFSMLCVLSLAMAVESFCLPLAGNWKVQPDMNDTCSQTPFRGVWEEELWTVSTDHMWEVSLYEISEPLQTLIDTLQGRWHAVLPSYDTRLQRSSAGICWVNS